MRPDRSIRQNGRAPVAPQRRLLGEARREAAETAHIAASKRRRLAASTDHDHDDEEDDDDPSSAAGPVSSGALGDDDAAVFADAVYEEDDRDADFVYEQVDLRMQSRRQKQRDSVLQKQLSSYREVNPTVRQQFADLKSGLSDVSMGEWAAIPDIGDYSVKKDRFQKFTPMPDSLLERARQENASVAVEPSSAGATTDLAAIGAGRTSVLEHNLDAAGERSVIRDTVDHDGYLYAMTGAKLTTDSNIADVKKARQLLKSVTTANPTHAPGWIASARLEEQAGKFSTARKLILTACRKCLKDEEIWLEAARLHPRDMARRIFAQAVRHIPKSLNVWLQAADLEGDIDAKRRVLRKALEIIPQSARLWQAAVELEEPAGACILLSRAVECAPSCVTLWLALAKLQPYDDAKDTLRRARSALPHDVTIWITEAQLEEVQHGDTQSNVCRVIAEGVRVMATHDPPVSKETWLQHAEVMDRARYTGTVDAIVSNALDLTENEEQANRDALWLADAKRYEDEKCVHLARAIHRHLTNTFPQRVALWRGFAEFERRQEDYGRMQAVLDEGVSSCEGAEVLWLMLAKDKWKREGVDQARDVLKRAFEKLPDEECIWLAAAKVETEGGEFDRGRLLLERARAQAPSAKIFMKSALLERQVGNREAERRLLVLGLEAFPQEEKLWLMLAQWFEREGSGGQMNGHAKTQTNTSSDVAKLWHARGVYSTAVDHCKTCVPLWIGYCRLEASSGNVSKARAILERGREQCSGRADLDLLWRESGYLEVRSSQRSVAQSVVSRALQECKHSGCLWALSLALEPRQGQKARSVDAITACPQSGVVMVEVAKFLWRSGKIEKSRVWFNRSVDVDRNFGDGWATLLAFEKKHGDEDRVREIERDAQTVEPKQGDLWTSVSKAVGNERLTCLEVLRQACGLVSQESNVTGLY